MGYNVTLVVCGPCDEETIDEVMKGLGYRNTDDRVSVDEVLSSSSGLIGVCVLNGRALLATASDALEARVRDLSEEGWAGLFQIYSTGGSYSYEIYRGGERTKFEALDEMGYASSMDGEDEDEQSFDEYGSLCDIFESEPDYSKRDDHYDPLDERENLRTTHDPESYVFALCADFVGLRNWDRISMMAYR